MKNILIILAMIASSLLAEEKLPNVLYINADDLGYTDIGAYGSTFYQTPNIDKLVSSGIRFTDGYAAASNCSPSRVSMMTGQWTPRHKVFTVNVSTRGNTKDRKLIPTKNEWYAPDDALLLSQVLLDAGYKTAHFGKWHINHDPLKSGIEENYGGYESGGPSKGGYHSPYDYPGVVAEEEGEYLTTRLGKEGAAYIKKSVNSDKPFFMHFTPYSVHTPIEPRADLLKHYKKKKKTERHNNPSYAAMVHALDEAVGMLITALEENNLLENTLIIFTSDNGGIEKFTDNYPLRAEKGSYYEGGIRIPFAISWKGKIKASEDSTPITHLDLFPTICSITKATVPEDKILDGSDLSSLLLNNEPLADRNLYWHFPIYLQRYTQHSELGDPKFRTRPGSVIRKGDWKLHEYFEDGKLELYNLKKDLSETKNLAKSNPQKAKELHDLLKAWRKETNAPVPTERNPEYRKR